MSSRWNPRVTKRVPPPWCHPGLFPVIGPIVAGQPSYVIAELDWHDPDPIQVSDLSGTIRLAWSADDEYYSGHNTGTHLALGGKVTPTGEGHLYDVEVELWVDGELSESQSFSDVRLGPDFPWDSGQQRLISEWPTHWVGIQVTV